MNPWRSWCPDRYSGMHMAFRNGYVSEPRTRPMGLAGDLHARRKDGSEFPIEVTLSPLETDEGLLVSAAVRDISERRRMQEETDRVKDEFFATVSHELRTPLTSMIGYSELMTDLEELSPQGQRFLSVIMRSAERELRLVDDLLTLVAIEESGLAIRSAEIDLERVVREAVEAAMPRAEEARLALSLETPGTAVAMYGDRDRLGQAMDNLLSNAIKFTPAGGRVRVVLHAAGHTATIDVIDTGVGHRDRGPRPALRASLPHPDGGGPADAWRGAGADDRPGDRGGARGHHRGGQQRQGRNHLPDDLPAPAGRRRGPEVNSSEQPVARRRPSRAARRSRRARRRCRGRSASTRAWGLISWAAKMPRTGA